MREVTSARARMVCKVWNIGRDISFILHCKVFVRPVVHDQTIYFSVKMLVHYSVHRCLTYCKYDVCSPCNRYARTSTVPPLECFYNNTVYFRIYHGLPSVFLSIYTPLDLLCLVSLPSLALKIAATMLLYLCSHYRNNMTVVWLCSDFSPTFCVSLSL